MEQYQYRRQVRMAQCRDGDKSDERRDRRRPRGLATISNRYSDCEEEALWSSSLVRRCCCTSGSPGPGGQRGRRGGGISTGALFVVFISVILIIAMALLERAIALEKKALLHQEQNQMLLQQLQQLQYTNHSNSFFSSSVDAQSANANNFHKKNTFILAAAPRGPRYATALWTQLECFADPTKYSSLVVVVPTWAQEIVTQILQSAQQRIPQFQNDASLLSIATINTSNEQITSSRSLQQQQFPISLLFKENDRYDVGLWCDALNELGFPRNDHEQNKNATFVLSNDSIFALRPFTGILDQLLSHPELDMTSLNYHNSSDGYWVESILRGFTHGGMQRYWNYACIIPKTHRYYCPNYVSKIKKKRCIVDHFEIAIAKLYKDDQVMGLYPSASIHPETGQVEMPYSEKWGKTWVSNQVYWQNILRQKYNFPAAKTKNPRMVVNITENQSNSPDSFKANPLLQSCTRYIDWDLIQNQLHYPQTMGNLEIPKIMGKRSKMVERKKKSS